MLCEICNGLFRETHSPEAFTQIPSFDHPISHHQSYTTLHKSWRQKCTICYRLYKRLHTCWPAIEKIHHQIPSPLIVVVAEVEPFIAVGRKDMEMRFTFSQAVVNSPLYTQSAVRLEVLAMFGLWPQSTSSWQMINDVNKQTNVAACGPLIKTWLRECRESHQTCERQVSTHNQWYPTRLLDLEAAKDGRIRLIVTRNHKIQEPYATLSHCWGDSNILKLTQANYKRMQTSILLADLPRSFTDAIGLATYRSTRYIWIDSLMIIQDSKEDWVQESAQMGKVYKNAQYNIGAGASENSEGGLFLPRDPELVNPFPITLNQTDYMLVWNSLWYSGIDDSHLLQRGWVFQERWLTPRMIHFSNEQVLWECSDGLACETHPSILETHESIYTSFKDRDSQLEVIGAKVTDSERHTYALRLWNKLVYEYSSTKLSFETDKLVAISGIAKEIQGILKDDYIAGLWKRNMVAQLAWRSIRSLTPRTIGSALYLLSQKPKQYVAPSWSWASVQGTIEMNGAFPSKEDEVCTVMNVHVELATTDPTGELNNGFICLQSAVTEVLITKSASQYYVGRNHYDVTIVGSTVDKAGSKELVTMDIDTDEITWNRQYYFIALHKIRSGFGRVVGLLLEPTDESSTEFRRVGRLMCPSSPRVAIYLEIKTLPKLSNNYFHSSQGYVIKII